MLEYQECPWYALENSYKTLFGTCVILLGAVGVLLNVWMIVTFIQSRLLSFKSHLLVLNMCTASLARGILGGFPFSGPSALTGRWIFGDKCCTLFAFLHQLMGIFQMTSLCVLCLERYLIAKRAKLAKDLQVKFYIVCILFCWSYSAAFSFPPLMHYGSYGCDITGTYCSLDWRCSNMRQISFNILVIIFGGVIPIISIIITLCKAISLSKKRYLMERDWEQWSLTKNTAIMAGIVVLFWIPQAMLILWISFGSCGQSLRFTGSLNIVAVLAPLCSEASTMVPLLCYLSSEPRIRTALLGRCKKNYGIIRKRRPSDYRMIANQ